MLGSLFRLLRLFGSGSKPRQAYKATQQPWQPAASVKRPPRPQANRILEGRCHVIDGDTIVIDGTHIRLAGIDAPELDQPYGQKAKFALIALCKGKRVKAILTDDTSYERVVATCLLPDGTDLSAALVTQGLALDWAKFSGGSYRHLEPQGVRKKLWRVDAKHKGRLKMEA
ncbi:MAG: thermonuclease family protein [Paracoccus sp. (in: a-proteobacteria)]|uniref:thermonuclease family protein n=1 Tax=Paracoccus sp. TaxID=267 RepID=UPI004058132F